MCVCFCSQFNFLLTFSFGFTACTVLDSSISGSCSLINPQQATWEAADHLTSTAQDFCLWIWWRPKQNKKTGWKMVQHKSCDRKHDFNTKGTVSWKGLYSSSCNTGLPNDMDAFSSSYKAVFTLHGSSGSIPVFSPHVAQIGFVCVSSKKAHGLWYYQIQFRPHPYVEKNLTRIRYVSFQLWSKQTDQIFPVNVSPTSLKNVTVVHFNEENTRTKLCSLLKTEKTTIKTVNLQWRTRA